MSTFMDINMAMRPVNAVFRKGVMFISSDEVIRVRKGSGDINGGLSQTSGGQNRLARMINLMLGLWGWLFYYRNNFNHQPITSYTTLFSNSNADLLLYAARDM